MSELVWVLPPVGWLLFLGSVRLIVDVVVVVVVVDEQTKFFYLTHFAAFSLFVKVSVCELDLSSFPKPLAHSS